MAFLWSLQRVMGMEYLVCISGCCVLALSETLLPAAQQDVIDTLLFAQLAADEDFPEDPDGQGWIDVYKNTFSECGWTFDLQKTTAGEFSSTRQKAFSLRDVFAAVSENNVSADQAAISSAALDTVAELPDESEVKQAFRKHAVLSVEGQKRIRVRVAVVDGSGSLSMASVFFDTRGSVGRLFSEREFAFDEVSGAMNANFYTARFSLRAYNEYRTDTVQWLGTRRQAGRPEVARLSIS